MGPSTVGLLIWGIPFRVQGFNGTVQEMAIVTHLVRVLMVEW